LGEGVLARRHVFMCVRIGNERCVRSFELPCLATRPDTRIFVLISCWRYVVRAVLRGASEYWGKQHVARERANEESL
jgi:hypothetical protein